MAHGKASPQPPLPAATETDVVRIDVEERRQRAPGGDAKDFPTLTVAVAVTAAGAAEPDRLANFSQRTLSFLSKSKRTSHGFLICDGPALFKCSISPSQLARTALILDAIERALPTVGGKVVRGPETRPLSLDFDGQQVIFSVAERFTRTSVIPESQRHNTFPVPDYTYHFTGELKLSVDGYFDGRKSWSDGKRGRLEDKLKEVVLGLAAAAAAMRRLTQERLAQRAKAEEVARIRQAHEAEERRRLAFQGHFAAEASAWQRHHEAVAYLAHLRQSLQSMEPLLPASVAWLAQAQEAVQALDPSGGRLTLLQQGYEPESWLAPFGVKLVKQPAGLG